MKRIFVAVLLVLAGASNLLAAIVSIILAGQSNAAGAGTPVAADLLPDAAPIVVMTQQSGIRDSQEPWNGTGVSAGRSLARFVMTYDPTITQVWVISCPLGSTWASQWLPNAVDGLARQCGAMSARAETFGATPIGIVWMQGESDSGIQNIADLYYDRFTRIVRGFRMILGKPLPFVSIELPKHLPAGKMLYRETVDQAMRLVMSEQPTCAFVETEDLTAMKSPTVHWERGPLRVIGQRAALALTQLHSEGLAR